MRKFHIATIMLSFLLIGPYWTTANAGESYPWPDFQHRLWPGPSNSPIKAEFPRAVDAIAVEPGTPEAKAAYGGIWEGWMCGKKAVDVKVAITDVTDRKATVVYVAAAESWRQYYAGGVFSRSASASFKADTLQATLGRGLNLILGLRPDGHLNIKWESRRPSACFGILKKSSHGPKTDSASAADTASVDQAKALAPREVTKLLENNTIDSVIEKGGARGVKYVAHLRADGTAVVLTNQNERITGTWRVNGKGLFCRTMPGLRPKTQERCHAVTRSGAGGGFAMRRPRDMDLTESFTVLTGNAKDL